MENILVCVDHSAQLVSSCNYALGIAKMTNAHVDVLYASDIRSFESCAISGLEEGDGVILEVINRLRTLEALKAKAIEKSIKTTFQDGNYGEHVDFHHMYGYPVELVEEFAKNERGVDLIVIGRWGENSGKFRENIGATAERIIKSTAIPCLVAAEKYVPTKRILVAYDGSEHSRAAVRGLLHLEKLLRGEIHVVTVESENATPSEELALDKVSQLFEEVGHKTVTAILKGTADEAVVEYIKKHSINMLVMGAYGHSGIRRFIVGSNTTKILANTDITAIVYHTS
jgi:nucleotide-binding universal stress UspA family protein